MGSEGNAAGESWGRWTTSSLVGTAGSGAVGGGPYGAGKYAAAVTLRAGRAASPGRTALVSKPCIPASTGPLPKEIKGEARSRPRRLMQHAKNMAILPWRCSRHERSAPQQAATMICQWSSKAGVVGNCAWYMWNLQHVSCVRASFIWAQPPHNLKASADEHTAQHNSRWRRAEELQCEAEDFKTLRKGR